MDYSIRVQDIPSSSWRIRRSKASTIRATASAAVSAAAAAASASATAATASSHARDVGALGCDLDAIRYGFGCDFVSPCSCSP
jgi:hypothetical protein